MEQWTTIINKSELIDEIRKAPDDRFSFMQAVQEVLFTGPVPTHSIADRFGLESQIISAKYTFGRAFIDNDYTTSIIKHELTRSLTTKFEDICDEIDLAFKDLVPQPEKEGGELIIYLSPTPAIGILIVARLGGRPRFKYVTRCRVPSKQPNFRWSSPLYVIHGSERFMNTDGHWRTQVETRTGSSSTSSTRSTSPINRDFSGGCQTSCVRQYFAGLHSAFEYANRFCRFFGYYMLMTDQKVRRAMEITTPILEERFRMYDETGGDWTDKPVCPM